jgi:hypothetical protein
MRNLRYLQWAMSVIPVMIKCESLEVLGHTKKTLLS